MERNQKTMNERVAQTTPDPFKRSPERQWEKYRLFFIRLKKGNRKIGPWSPEGPQERGTRWNEVRGWTVFFTTKGENGAELGRPPRAWKERGLLARTRTQGKEAKGVKTFHPTLVENKVLMTHQASRKQC